MTLYCRAAIREQHKHPTEGLIHSLLTAEIDGARLSEEEVIANCIVTMVGGQETTTNLIGNGLVTLLRHPEQMAKLAAENSLIVPAAEELLRYESPSQHTARLERFPDPDRLDLERTDNRHLAFGWAAHFCFGAPLARMEGQIAFATLLRRLPQMKLSGAPLRWRENLGLRGLRSLPIQFQAKLDRTSSAAPQLSTVS